MPTQTSIQGQPQNTTILITNLSQSGETWVVLPESGTLWVAYEAGSEPLPDQSVYIWHQGGTTEPVPLGQSTFQVGATDALVYRLGSPDAMIKLGWAYE